ncbi:MAG: hypothetical protein EXR71_17435 [Myxococcales bacterium]|nr:hypothetical protein [Myxococcales bacterium]
MRPRLLISLLAGCAGPSAPEITVSGTVGTVATAVWTDGGVQPSRIVVRTGGIDRLASGWQQPELAHTATLVGMNAETECEALVELEDGTRSEPTSFVTSPLPVALPEISVEGDPGWEGWLLTSIIGTETGPLLLDPQGRVVWWHFATEGGHASRARFRADGRGVWYGYAQSEARDEGGLASVDWTGTPIEVIHAPAFSHDLWVAPDGALAWIEFDRRFLANGNPVWGNRLMSNETGAPESLWTTYDTWNPEVTGPLAAGGYWTGCNALDFDADSGHYYLGSRGFAAVVELDPTSGTVIRQIGGPTSDYEFPNERDGLELQHNFQLVDGGLLVHDNRNEALGSRAVELTLDDEAGTASYRWSWQHEPPLYSFALGDVDRGADGSTLITWGAPGVIDDVGPDDVARASLSANLGTMFGFTDRVEQLPGMAAP